MANVSSIDGHMDNAEHCICCGEVIPEERQVCPQCEAEAKESKDDDEIN